MLIFFTDYIFVTFFFFFFPNKWYKNTTRVHAAAKPKETQCFLLRTALTGKNAHLPPSKASKVQSVLGKTENLAQKEARLIPKQKQQFIPMEQAQNSTEVGCRSGGHELWSKELWRLSRSQCCIHFTTI